ncbi:MAG TPA: Fe-S cluster assembly protein SufD [Candidatus Limnocylindria bacterium]|nr:Fe-S cluster assembly protein SufD [Candidatus Limnocylindria bacterium]
MTEPITRDTFLAAYAERERRGAFDGPAWLRAARRAAIDRFAERGLPTTRDEAWKYTSLAPLVATPLELAADAAREVPSEDALARVAMGPASWSRLVFVDGRYVAKLSTIRPLPPGGRLGSLAEALITDEPTVRAHLAGAAEAPAAESGDAFGALNAAFWSDGAFLHVPAGVSLEEPIQLLFVATAPEAPRADHPRSLIVLEPSSRAVLVESYVALGAAAYLTNASTEIALDPGAVLDHQRVVLEGRRGVHVGRIRVRQGPDSRFASCAVTLGGRLVRNDVDARLDAEGAECALNGLFVVGGVQHVDTHTVVDHAQPRTTSRQLYKGVLDGRARGVFNGRVIVRPGANGTDAHQTNKNLILSDGVEVDSKPQLEIFADDVKCSHGAADGQLAEDAIFYLESRGLDEAAARTLLTHGFANEVLGRIRVEPVRVWCEELLRGRLRGGRVPEEAA